MLKFRMVPDINRDSNCDSNHDYVKTVNAPSTVPHSDSHAPWMLDCIADPSNFKEKESAGRVHPEHLLITLIFGYKTLSWLHISFTNLPLTSISLVLLAVVKEAPG